MEDLLKEFITLFQTSSLHLRFWDDYSFWLGLLNLIVLGITLTYLIKYTRATQEMKDEIIHQRIITNANDVYFKMMGHYIEENAEKRVFGVLKTPITVNNVCKFIFLNSTATLIGYTGRGYLDTKNENLD